MFTLLGGVLLNITRQLRCTGQGCHDMLGGLDDTVLNYPGLPLSMPRWPQRHDLLQKHTETKRSQNMNVSGHIIYLGIQPYNYCLKAMGDVDD